MATIHRPLRGPLTIQMPFAADNGDWLRREVPLHKGASARWNKTSRLWELPLSCFDELLTAAGQRFASITVTEHYSSTSKCTTDCLEARAATVDKCTCLCEGEWHARGRNAGWRQIGERLVISWNDQECTYRVEWPPLVRN